MAAGKGTRLKSQLPKVLHEVGGKPLLTRVIAAATRVVPPADVFAIIGHEAERVRSVVEHTGVNFILQADQRGTGHALMVAQPALSAYDHVIVIYGDVPQITPQTIARLLNFHLDQQAAMTLLSADFDHPTGYGRVIRKNPRSAEVEAIVEEKAASPSQKAIHEINAGFYVFALPQLLSHIEKLSTANPHGEYYLTDMAALLRRARQRVVVWKTEDSSEVLGANTLAELSAIDQHIRMLKCQQLMAEGVTIFYPATCVIDDEVEIAPDTVIEPSVQILGRSRIGAACHISSFCVIRNSEVGPGVLFHPGCILAEAHIGTGAILGPYSHLRPGSDIGEGAHIGNFVETKKIRIGKGSKANHLTYLGRCRNWCRRQHRRRIHHLQLRWLPQAHYSHRRRSLHRQRHHPGRSRARRQRCLHRRSLMYHQRRPRRRAGGRPCPPSCKGRMGPRKTRREETKVGFTTEGTESRTTIQIKKKAPRPGSLRASVPSLP